MDKLANRFLWGREGKQASDNRSRNREAGTITPLKTGEEQEEDQAAEKRRFIRRKPGKKDKKTKDVDLVYGNAKEPFAKNSHSDQVENGKRQPNADRDSSEQNENDATTKSNTAGDALPIYDEFKAKERQFPTSISLSTPVVYPPNVNPQVRRRAVPQPEVTQQGDASTETGGLSDQEKTSPARDAEIRPGTENSTGMGASSKDLESTEKEGSTGKDQQPSVSQYRESSSEASSIQHSGEDFQVKNSTSAEQNEHFAAENILARLQGHLLPVFYSPPDVESTDQIDVERAVIQLLESVTEAESNKKELQESQTANEVLRDDLKTAKEERLHARQERSRYEQELNTKKQELSTKTSQLDAARGEIVSLGNQKNRIESDHGHHVTKLQNDHEKETKRLHGRYGMEVNHLKGTITQHKGTISQLNSTVVHLNGVIKQLKREKESIRNIHDSTLRRKKWEYDEEVRKLGYNHENKIKEMQGHINRLEGDKTVLSGQHSLKLRDVEGFWQRELATAEARYREDLRQTSENAATERLEMEQLQKSAIEQLKSSHSLVLSEWQEACENNRKYYEGQLATKDASHKEEITQLTDRMDQMERNAEDTKSQMIRDFQAERESFLKSHEKDLSDLNERHEKDMKDLELSHKENTVNLRKDLEMFKGRVVSREYFKGLTDPEISSRYQKLVNAVDRISRTPWDRSKERSWPYRESKMAKSENVRKLKQHIIQSSIWGILFDNIFYTPFQVFGEEGKILHREWTESCGGQSQDAEHFQHWPKPTQDSERLRHDMIKQCLEAIEQSGDISDVKQRQKQDYDQTLSAVRNAISEMKAHVASVDGNELQRIDDLVRLAAKFWLDIGSQRYRILVICSKSRAGSLRMKTLELVVKPELRRNGNSQGQELERQDAVRGCEGEYSEFEPQ